MPNSYGQLYTPVRRVPIVFWSFPKSPRCSAFTSSNHSKREKEDQPTSKMTPARKHSKRTAKTTAKKDDRNHPRHLIVHNYHDYANVTKAEAEEVPKKRRRGGVTTPFPTKLMETLDKIEADGYSHIISWQPHGRCFVIHKQRLFAERILPE